MSEYLNLRAKLLLKVYDLFLTNSGLNVWQDEIYRQFAPMKNPEELIKQIDVELQWLEDAGLIERRPSDFMASLLKICITDKGKVHASRLKLFADKFYTSLPY